MQDSKLIIGISSRALFDLDESHEIYKKQGLKSYEEYQIDNEDKTLKPGMQVKNFVSSTIFAAVIIFFSVVHYSFPGVITLMDDFPTHPAVSYTHLTLPTTLVV